MFILNRLYKLTVTLHCPPNKHFRPLCSSRHHGRQLLQRQVGQPPAELLQRGQAGGHLRDRGHGRPRSLYRPPRQPRARRPLRARARIRAQDRPRPPRPVRRRLQRRPLQVRINLLGMFFFSLRR